MAPRLDLSAPFSISSSSSASVTARPSVVLLLLTLPVTWATGADLSARGTPLWVNGDENDMTRRFPVLPVNNKGMNLTRVIRILVVSSVLRELTWLAVMHYVLLTYRSERISKEQQGRMLIPNSGHTSVDWWGDWNLKCLLWVSFLGRVPDWPNTMVPRMHTFRWYVAVA